jgi:hypothetical protein
MKRILNVRRSLVLGIMVLHTLLMNGCGYRLIGASPEAPQHFTVAIPVFRNLTYRAAAEGEFTEAIVTSLLHHGVRVRDGATADYIVTGEIVSLVVANAAFSAADKAVLNKAEVVIDLTIRSRQENTILLHERIRRRISYPVQSQLSLQQSVDAAAQQELAEQTAQVVLLRLQTLPHHGTQP